MIATTKPKFMVSLTAVAVSSGLPARVLYDDQFAADSSTMLIINTQATLEAALRQAFQRAANLDHPWLEPRIYRINIEVVRRCDAEEVGNG